MAVFDLSKITDLLPFLRKPTVPIKHELKWKIPEMRMCAPIADAEAKVAELRKTSIFVSGGQFLDSIYAKDFGQGVFAYFIVRTDKNTEKETLIFDGYMIQEEDEKLGINIEVSFELMKNLTGMGYKQELAREVSEWNFIHAGLPVSIFDITDFGQFLQVSVPATKFEADRRLSEKKVDKFLEHQKIAKRDAIPTDVITLQIMLAKQQEEANKQPQLGTKFGLGKDSPGTGGNSIL